MARLCSRILPQKSSREKLVHPITCFLRLCQSPLKLNLHGFYFEVPGGRRKRGRLFHHSVRRCCTFLRPANCRQRRLSDVRLSGDLDQSGQLNPPEELLVELLAKVQMSGPPDGDRSASAHPDLARMAGDIRRPALQSLRSMVSEQARKTALTRAADRQPSSF